MSQPNGTTQIIDLTSPTTPVERLRALLGRREVVRLMGAHSPLGARLAEQAGFDGIWASGLETSAAHGVPDADILSMAEVQSVAASLAAAVHIPVVGDCDAGYGNVPNVMNMVRRFEAGGVAGVCIEDKRFPKINSFVGDQHPLVPIDEFCAKIIAATSTRRPGGLVVIARVEALIAGLTVSEALDRATAYAEAGADAVLIHDRASEPDAILEFLSSWHRDTPIVVVPTTYHTIRARELGEAGARVVIYANHGLRAQVAATRRVFAQILDDDRTTEVEPELATLKEIFELQGVRDMLDRERDYLAAGRAAAATAASLRNAAAV